jgi:hypothetical protein
MTIEKYNRAFLFSNSYDLAAVGTFADTYDQTVFTAVLDLNDGAGGKFTLTMYADSAQSKADAIIALDTIAEAVLSLKREIVASVTLDDVVDPYGQEEAYPDAGDVSQHGRMSWEGLTAVAYGLDTDGVEIPRTGSDQVQNTTAPTKDPFERVTRC